MCNIMWNIVIYIIILTIIIELITCLFRFGFKIKAKEFQKKHCKLYFGKRIHHAYFGPIFLIISLFFNNFAQVILISLGISLILSDLIHHFIVLKQKLK